MGYKEYSEKAGIEFTEMEFQIISFLKKGSGISHVITLAMEIWAISDDTNECILVSHPIYKDIKIMLAANVSKIFKEAFLSLMQRGLIELHQKKRFAVGEQDHRTFWVSTHEKDLLMAASVTMTKLGKKLPHP